MKILSERLIYEEGDWVRILDKAHFNLEVGKIYEVAHHCFAYDLPDKVAIWNGNEKLNIYIFRVEWVQRQFEMF